MTVLEKLKQHGTKFTIKNFRHRRPFEIRVTEMEEYDDIISVSDGFYQMNVDRFGKACLWLFAFDMMGNKTTAKIKFDDIEFIEE